MSRLNKISHSIQGIGLLGCLIFVWRYIDWQLIQGAPTSMGNLEILGPTLGFIISLSVFLLGLLLLLASSLWHRFKATP